MNTMSRNKSELVVTKIKYISCGPLYKDIMQDFRGHLHSLSQIHPGHYHALVGHPSKKGINQPSLFSHQSTVQERN